MNRSPITCIEKLHNRVALLSSGLLSLGLLTAAPAYATDYLLTVGKNGFTTNNDSILVQANDRFFIDFTAGRSYSCEGVPQDAASDFDWNQTVQGTAVSNPETILARLAGTLEPAITGEASTSSDNRLTFTPTTTDRFRLTVQSAKSGGELVKVQCTETTLFGDFNTNVNDFNYLELTNLSNASISGTITAITSDGTVAVNAATFTIAPDRRFDVDLHSAVGADKYGLVRVTQNGPAGALKAIVSQYQGTPTNFTLTATIPLVPVGQRQ